MNTAQGHPGGPVPEGQHGLALRQPSHGRQPPVLEAQGSKSAFLCQIWYPVLLASSTTTIFALTAWVALATFTSSITVAGFRIDASSTLTGLSILQGILSILVSLALSEAFELIGWALTGRNSGLRSASLLGLSPTTSVLGSLRIIFSRDSRLADRLWPLLRNALAVALWASGVVLFADTDLGVIYEPVETYQATAGVGRFNGSLVRPYLQHLQDMSPGYPYPIVPYSMQSIVYNLNVNPMHSVASEPVSCDNDACDSYLLTGGLILTTPWAPTTHPSAPVIQIPNVPGCQIDFQAGIRDGDAFSDSDCSVFGDYQTDIAIRFCVAKSKKATGFFSAGLYVCPGSIRTDDCTISASISSPNITTTFAIYSREATIVTSRSNFSTISATSLSPPTQNLHIDLRAFRDALDWILNYNASRIPPPTSIAEQFWAGQSQLQDTYWSPELKQTFQSILTFPLWVFNVNNIGNIDGDPHEINQSLPPEFYTTASIAIPHTKIIISTAMFTVFIVFQSIIQLFIWCAIVWLCIKQPCLPEITSYPLVNFAFKTRYERARRIGDKQSPDNLTVAAFKVDNGDVLAALGPCDYFTCDEKVPLLAANHGPLPGHVPLVSNEPTQVANPSISAQTVLQNGSTSGSTTPETGSIRSVRTSSTQQTVVTSRTPSDLQRR